MQNLPIGIFDSGIGGLTVAHSLKEQLPNESIIYFGDTEHLPYGEKSEESIQNFSKKITRFLLKKKCKAIVMACNSASAVASHVVNITAKNIPVFNVIDPVTIAVASNCRYCEIGVIGTKATIESGIYSRKIKEICSTANIAALSTPLLVPMIEEGFINEDISHQIIAKYLSNKLLANIDSIILACTHYPLIHKEIDEFYNNNVRVVDSADIVANHIAKEIDRLELINTETSPEYNFYVSNYTKSFAKSAKFFFQEEIKIEEVNILI